MRTLYLSLLSGILSIILPLFLDYKLIWTFIPGVLTGVLVFVYLNRKYGKKIEQLLNEANQELQSAQEMAQRANAQANPVAMKAAQQLMEKKTEHAVEILKRGLEYSDWQLGSRASLNAQIGMVIFSNNIFQAAQGQKNKLGDAIPYLEESLVKGMWANLLKALWHAWLRLAVCHFRVTQDFASVTRVMEQVCSAARTEGFVWSVYGWFYMQKKQRTEAIEVLARGLEESKDPQLKANLEALQNGKSLKMGDYGNLWWSLGLELPKHMMARAQSMGHPRMKTGSRARR